MNLGSAEEELRCLRDELTTAPDPEALFQASSKMARVPAILNIIYSHVPTIQEGSLRQFLLEAVSILAHHHLEAVLSSLLRKRLPMDRQHVPSLRWCQHCSQAKLSEVIGESMKALAKVLKELKEKDIGSSFKNLTEQIRAYFDDAKENAELLENLYSTTIASFSSSWEGIRAGAANLAGER
ncbi:maestro heat-like repeat-containing protein family member 2A [Mauremys reevesii]|uniref:maestro heat-like repeat-containing protein family member 2A n=1 Tax=Mauremys reevesii TaxID=260615 RepID=UPI00193F8312|nr:maestro heat-like repeat-containing protein family member 2A [Mauremys reevesii]